jgi:ABC-type transport system involved in cytochrome c biogenesis permease component
MKEREARNETSRALSWLEGRRIDEALAERERRRIRRWFWPGRPQAMVLAACLGGAWLVAPGLWYALGGDASLAGRPAWLFGSLMVAIALCAVAVSFGRASQLWWGERNGGTLEAWLLTRQAPDAVVHTATAASALLGLAPLWPALALAVVLVLSRGAAWVLPGLLALLAGAIVTGLGALLVAALAGAIFFQTLRALPPRRVAVGAALILALWLGLWLRLEAVAGGWRGPWEYHFPRAFFAFLLLTPVPHLFGLANPDWWRLGVLPRLPELPSPLSAVLLLSLLYAVGTLLFISLARAGYRALCADPELLSPAGGARSGDRSAPVHPVTPSPAQPYWKGFGNPVWTREIRTRLRGREAAEVIFFASIAIAAAGFLPLLLASGRLEDPLGVAEVARGVYFWLGMTLIAFLALLVPGLTAEAVGIERARGTLDLLLATPMSASAILRGKLLGSVSIVLLLLSPSLPLFGLVTLFHGAEASQVLALYAVLACYLALCAGFGVTASAMHERILPAKVQAYVLSFIAAGLPGGAAWAVIALSTPMAEEGRYAIFLLTPALVIFFGAFLVRCWENARVRLRYAE